MSFPSFVPKVDANITTASLNATTAASAVEVGASRRVIIGCTGAVTVLFGGSSVGAPSGTAGTVVPAGNQMFDMGLNTHVRVYNTTGSAISYSVTTVF